MNIFKKSMKKLLVFIGLFLVTGIITAYSQEERPKLAIVLSGGGAKGVAHIPLLKVLDSLKVKPDLIVGTSMGSVMGGLYAMGYSADTIASIAINMDWDELLTNSVPYNYVPPSERDQFGKYSIKIPVRNFKPELPSGLIESQELSLLFNRLSTAVIDKKDFDDFPISYRAVSTDIVYGKKVPIGEGDVAMAIRSSMAIPTFFTPVELDGTILVDGGVLDNFPVGVAQELGAEIIIGSDVSGGFIPKDEINTLVEVMKQSAVISSAQLNEQARRDCDIFLDHVPNLTYNTQDFSASAEIYEQGKKALKDNLDDLVELLEPYKGTATGQRARPLTSIKYKEVRFKGISSQYESYLTRRVGLDKDGGEIEISNLENELRHGYGTQLFSQLTYRVIKEQDNYILVIQGKEKLKSYFQGALHFDSERGAGIIFNATTRDLVGKNSRSLISVDAAENPKVRLQHQQYLPNPWYWWRLEYFNETVNQNLYSDGFEDGVFKFNFQSLNLSLNRDLNANTTLTLTAHASLDAMRPDIEGETRNIPKDSLVFSIQRFSHASLGAELGFNYNTLNQRFFPTKGTNFMVKLSVIPENNLNIKWYSDALTQLFEDAGIDLLPSLGNVTSLQMNYEKNISLGDKLTFRGELFTGFLIAEKDSLFADFGALKNNFLGGIEFRPNPQYIRFPGLRDGEAPVSQLMGTRLTLQWEIVNNLYVMPSLNAAVLGYGTFGDYTESMGNFSTNWSSQEGPAHWVYSGALNLAYMSPLGPIQFMVAKPNDVKDLRFYFGVGFHFM